MTPTPRTAVITMASILAYLGIAILGRDGFAAFFSRPALIALAIALVAMAGIGLFSGGHLGAGEREEPSLPIRLSPTATSGSVRPCSWTFTSVAIFGSHNRSQSSSDFFPTTRPAPPTWRRLAGATGLFAPIVSRGVSANHPSRLRKPENVAERHPSRGQSPAPASLPQRIHLPFQQAVLSVQRLPFPESWSRLSEQFFRVDKWSLCRG